MYNTKSLGTYDSNASLSIVCIGIITYAYITEFLLIAETLISLEVSTDRETDVNLYLTKSNFMSNIQMLNLNAAFMSLEVVILAIYYKYRVGIKLMPFALTFLAFQVAAGVLIQYSCNKMIASEVAKRKKKAEDNPIKEGNVISDETGRKQQEDCGQSEEGSFTN